MPSVQADNIRLGYEDLEKKVQAALRTQVGDAVRLGQTSAAVGRFMRAAEAHQAAFPAAEFATLCQSLADMQAALDRAVTRSSDPLTTPHLKVIEKRPNGKGTGRPRLEIKQDFLASALNLRGPTGIASSLTCSARTVRRRALEAGLVAPAPPVRRHEVQPDGHIAQVWQSTGPAISAISNDPEALDAQVADILQLFPHFGREMISGALSARGFRVPRDRIEASYLRVRGVPPMFGNRDIERRIYSVPGVNSLWHHDGQHGLIRWKFVTHAFIDGKSRYITGIRVSTNNLGQTVLELFDEAVDNCGWPSRVRGDHGVENIKVAERMEAVKGAGRGSYIWGRSVHNIRIERLWVDFTRGIGKKWVEFFYGLEASCKLSIDNPAHLWLLHHLFVSHINADVKAWAASWNSHKITIAGERKRSPRDMFTFGLLEQGPRGIGHLIQAEEDAVVDYSQFGVDWEAHGIPAIAAHHANNNPGDWDPAHPFHTFATPSNMSEVVVDAPNCPFTIEERAILDAELATRVNVNSRDMAVRKLIWQEALAICVHLDQ